MPKDKKEKRKKKLETSSSDSSDHLRSPTPEPHKKKKKYTKKQKKVGLPVAPVPQIMAPLVCWPPVLPAKWVPQYSAVPPILFTGSAEKGWGWVQRE